MSRFRALMFIIFSLFVVKKSNCQEYNYGDKINHVVTQVSAYYGNIVEEATGFYYLSGKIDSTKKDERDSLFLVSNRHLFYQNEQYPDSIIFRLTEWKVKGSAVKEWIPITLNSEYLKKNLIFHDNMSIDVAIIGISEIFNTHEINSTKINYIYPIRSEFVERTIKDIIPEIGDDIIILGYPNGFYDELNKIPIAKSGIISSFYGIDFEGLPKFIIDAKLFKSSSGSLVLGKHPILVIEDGKFIIRKSETLNFLGVYSGELFAYGKKVDSDDAITIPKRKMNLGVVWYPRVLEDIIHKTPSKIK